MQRDLGVLALLEDPRPHRLALSLGELLDELEDRLIARGGQLVDPGEVIVVEDLRLEGQPAASPILDTTATPALEQLVSGDAEHPRTGRATAPVAEASCDEEDRREHLCREVGGHFAVARFAQQEGHDGRQMATVEDGERLSVAGEDRRQELPVGVLRVLWHSTDTLRQGAIV